MASGEPVSQVQDDAGIQPGLERTEQDANSVERPFSPDEHHRDAADPPEQRDPPKRLPRADLLEQKVAGNLEQEIAEEENAGAKPVHRLAESEVGQHAQ